MTSFRIERLPFDADALSVWAGSDERNNNWPYVTDYGLLFAALTIVTVPMIAIYVAFNKQIVEGITAGSLK